MQNTSENRSPLPAAAFSVPAADFSLQQTLESGQCFRFRALEGGAYELTALGRRLTLWQRGDTLFGQGCEPRVFKERFVPYFSLDVDYAAIKQTLAKDERLAAAIDYAPGIRILRQPLWETLCCFILSQNNNIKRICGIVERLCDCFGDDLGGFRSFPEPGRLAALGPDSLAPLRCGFRDRYVIDAARRYVNGEIREAALRAAPLEEARGILTSIFGVGPKVADCVLLFGAGRLDAFPRDVWVNRAMAQLFPEGLPAFALPFAGIAQQYIFHYARLSGNVQ